MLVLGAGVLAAAVYALLPSMMRNIILRSTQPPPEWYNTAVPPKTHDNTKQTACSTHGQRTRHKGKTTAVVLLAERRTCLRTAQAVNSVPYCLEVKQGRGVFYCCTCTRNPLSSPITNEKEKQGRMRRPRPKIIRAPHYFSTMILLLHRTIHARPLLFPVAATHARG